MKTKTHKLDIRKRRRMKQKGRDVWYNADVANKVKRK